MRLQYSKHLVCVAFVQPSALTKLTAMYEVFVCVFQPVYFIQQFFIMRNSVTHVERCFDNVVINWCYVRNCENTLFCS